MRIVLALTLLLAGCDLPRGQATPAPTGISAASHGADPRFGGSEPEFAPRGSQMTIGAPRR